MSKFEDYCQQCGNYFPNGPWHQWGPTRLCERCYGFVPQAARDAGYPQPVQKVPSEPVTTDPHISHGHKHGNVFRCPYCGAGYAWDVYQCGCGELVEDN